MAVICALKDKNKKITERCSWSDPILNLFFKHRIILRDSHFGGRTVIADGMEEVMKCMVAEDPTLVRQSVIRTTAFFTACIS